MPFALSRLSVADTLSCSVKLRAAVEGERSVQKTAERACAFLYEAFTTEAGERAAPLVRLYVTHPYSGLPAEDQRFARSLLDGPVARWPTLKCLTLLGTSGDKPEWNDRTRSRGHRAIPLPTASIVEQAPMIAQLFLQMGVELSSVVRPAPALLSDVTKKTYNVFHVPRAADSPYIPAQADFVRQHGIESVVGFGGALPWGEHFAAVLFSRTPVSAAVASRFKSFALDVKSALLKFKVDDVFDSARTDAAPSVTPAAAPQPGLATPTAALPQPARGFRQFHDHSGVEWNVWAVIPSATAVIRGRNEQWNAGWLLFESAADSRRLSPIPADWHSRSEHELQQLCAAATPGKRTALRLLF
jgi:hypothetical protein